jgi:hypothetical protein
MRNRRKTILTGIAMAAILAFVSLGSSFYVVSDHSKEAKAKAELALRESEDAYGENGLPYGEALSKEILGLTDRYVVFKDRIVERYFRDEAQIGRAKTALRASFNSIPAGVSKHLMIVPWRTAYEAEALQFSEDIPSTIAEIYEAMPGDVAIYDVYGTLLAHSDDYVYFRMHDWWTPLGARYASEMLAAGLGIDMIDINDYEEHILHEYTGKYKKMYLEFDPAATTVLDEPIIYYLLRGGANRQTVTAKQKVDLPFRTFESPTIAVSRRSTDTFISAIFSHSVLRGDANNGKTLLIVGDGFAKPFAPWFTPYYESVYLVSMPFYSGKATGFDRIFEEYNITDCLILEEIGNDDNEHMRAFMEG